MLLDSAANAANRAVIGAGKNSTGTTVPVVNIQTPKMVFLTISINSLMY